MTNTRQIDLANNIHLFKNGGHSKMYSTMQDLEGKFWFGYYVESNIQIEDVFEESSKYEITGFCRLTPNLVAVYVTVFDEEMLTIIKLLIK